MKRLRTQLLKFMFSFLVSAVVWHILIQEIATPSYSSWYYRFAKEEAMVEMHAEDIWLHGRSTLIGFNPDDCALHITKDWFGMWRQVICLANDEDGEQWQYITTCRLNTTALAFLPFLTEKYIESGLSRVDTVRSKR